MRTILYLLSGLTFIFTLAACSPTNHGPSSGTDVKIDEAPKGNTVMENNVIPIHIIVGGSKFTASLNNNETTQALVAQFPMTLQMNELNGLEKFNDLPEALPSASSARPATIHAGDIMCWSGNTLVLFYHTFSNSYDGYAPLGSVDDPANLAAALGSGSVQVTWALAE